MQQVQPRPGLGQLAVQVRGQVDVADGVRVAGAAAVGPVAVVAALVEREPGKRTVTVSGEKKGSSFAARSVYYATRANKYFLCCFFIFV